MNAPPVGRVVGLWRYPVKSMRGEARPYLDVGARGVDGDRVFAVRDASGKLGSGKTTRRFRQIDGLLALSATWEEGALWIAFPEGRRILGSDPAIPEALSAVLGQPVTLVREGEVSHLDVGPLHLLTTASLAWLRSLRPDAQVDERRFRPNLLVDVPGQVPVERAWLGQTLGLGERVRLRVTAPTERCVMVGLAQAELPDDPDVLRDLDRHADAEFGVYAEVLSPGRVHRDDPLRVLP